MIYLLSIKEKNLIDMLWLRIDMLSTVLKWPVEFVKIFVPSKLGKVDSV